MLPIIIRFDTEFRVDVPKSVVRIFLQGRPSANWEISSMERRRNRRGSQSPNEMLRQLPALLVLDRLPVAALAVAEDGAIVFANRACADMLGYTPDELTCLQFPDLFRAWPPETAAVAAMHSFADVIVDLKHRDGSPVNARMSKSALQRDDDPVALVTFQDLTEQLWVHEL
jgi:PAS domain S-box-containing protein